MTAAAHAVILLEQRRDIDEGYEFDSGVELFGVRGREEITYAVGLGR